MLRACCLFYEQRQRRPALHPSDLPRRCERIPWPIDRAFGFHIFITSEVTGTFLDGAFHLVGSALQMFAVHDHVPHRVSEFDERLS
jgi:hypothetical protein